MPRKMTKYVNLQTFLFILPAIVLVGTFVYAFSIWNVFISLTDWRGLVTRIRFVGLENYLKLVSDPVAQKALINTFLLALTFIPLTMLIGLVVAILLDLELKGTSIFRTIFLLPLSFSFVVSATMWTWMFSPEQGTINSLLRLLHLNFLCQPWITSTEQSLWCILLVYVWQFSGYVTIIYYSGIRSIPKEHIEAAEIDGASTFDKYRYVVIPQLKGETVGVLTILLFYALRVFDLVYLLTGGGPALSSEVLATYMYRITFNQNLFAYGASIGTLIFVIALAIMVPFLILSRRR
ncbi:MAG: sugar ABC transporter permease [Candidatus Wolframiiraptor sp.]|nr:MAG: sugar ABC transporter permease [Candidatus Wolframiiraptor sp.]